MKAGKKAILAVTLLVCMIFMSSIFAALGSLMDPVTEKFGITGSAQGFPGTVSALGGICVFIVSLFLIGKIRKTALLALGIGLCVIPLFLIDLAESYPVYILLWTVIGFGLGFMDTLLSSCMADLYTGKTGIRMMCILHTFYGVTSMLAPLLFSAMLTGGTPFGKVYQLVGCFGAAVLTVLVIVSGKKQDSTVPEEKPLSLKAMTGMLTAGPLPLFAVGMAVHGFFLAGLNNWANRLTEEMNTGVLPEALLCFQGGLGQFSVFLGVMLSRLLFSFTGIPVRGYLKWGGVAAAISLAVGLFSGSSVILCVFMVLSGLCFGALIPCMLDTACAGVRGNTMLATTVMMLTLYLGEGISPSVLGWFEGSGPGLVWGVALCAGFMLLTAFCNTLALKKIKTDKNEETD
ncbi:MAG: MFS transporter [Clostridia bacterium]|nr:MFS transporter [Clostridia bacterium]